MTARQLKNSLLQRAVQGKLVPQDPKDEPASVLLKKIRADKERLIKAGKIKREKNPSVIFRGEDGRFYERVGKETACIEEELPFEIPESWEWARLGSISTYDGKKQKINAQNANPDMWGLDLEDIEKGGRIIAVKRVRERKSIGDKTYFQKGDILYSKLRPYLLKILIAPEDGICTSEIVPFKVFGGIVPEYIVCFLKSPHVDFLINSITYGVKMPRVGTDTMVNLLVPLPPTEEQKKIVQKIQEAQPTIDTYEELETAVSSLNSAFPDQLKKSILQQAAQGKLVAQDPKDEPASVLVARIRKEKQRLVKEGNIKKNKRESVVFKKGASYYEKADGVERCIDDEIPFEIPESWEWVRLGSIFHLQAGKNISASDIHSEQRPNYYPCFGGNGLRGFVPFYNHDGDYPIIGRQGALCGCINRASGKFYATEHAVCVETFAETDRSWACNFLIALNLNQYATATAQPGLAVSKINRVLIPLPPLAEQRRIVAKMEELLPCCESLKRG